MMADLGKDQLYPTASKELLQKHLPASSETAPKSSFCGTGQHKPLGMERGSNPTSWGVFRVPEDPARLLEELSVSRLGCPVESFGGFAGSFPGCFFPGEAGKDVNLGNSPSLSIRAAASGPPSYPGGTAAVAADSAGRFLCTWEQPNQPTLAQFPTHRDPLPQPWFW